MSNTIIPSNGNGNKPIQIGPPWYCFTCGAVARLDCYTKFHNPRSIPKDLDAWGEHIWYLLNLPCDHRPRVARLGDAITPIIFPYDDDPHPKWRTQPQQAEDEREAIRILREALVAIAAVHGPNPQADPSTAIVYQLVAGVLTPAQAIGEIRQLIDLGVRGALVEPLPDLAFQTDGEDDGKSQRAEPIEAWMLQVAP